MGWSLEFFSRSRRCLKASWNLCNVADLTWINSAKRPNTLWIMAIRLFKSESFWGKVQSPMPCIALWFIVFAMHHGLFVSCISWAREGIFVRVQVAVVLPWLFFGFVTSWRLVGSSVAYPRVVSSDLFYFCFIHLHWVIYYWLISGHPVFWPKLMLKTLNKITNKKSTKTI